MTSNANTNVSLPSLAFPTSNVRGATISYTVYRHTTTTTVAEDGTLVIVYNPNGPLGNKWEISNEHTGQGQVTFTITDQGQIQFTSVLLSGINHTGFIGYTAKALLQG